MNWMSILPPVVVLIVGYFSRRVLWSLFSGLVCATLLVKGLNPLDAIQYLAGNLLKTMGITKDFPNGFAENADNILICLFLLMLGVIITLLHHCGGAYAYKSFVKARIKKKQHVEMASLGLSLLLFIDDFFSSLTVGSVMHSITDIFRVPRAKLAYLVDAMAAPLAILCPFASWVAAIMGFLRDNGIHPEIGPDTVLIGSPLLVYVELIPFIFYSSIIFLSSWFIVTRKISFGLMGRFEKYAEETGDVFVKNPPKKQKKMNSASANFDEASVALRDFTVPIGFLIFFIVFGMLVSGGWLSGELGLIEALRKSQAAKGLVYGGGLALICSLVFLYSRKKIELKHLPHIITEGCSTMYSAIGILLFAWTLGGILRDDLDTGVFLAKFLIGSVSPESLPVLFFITATLVAFSIGSSWGTTAMLFPIAIEMLMTLQGVVGPIPVESLPLIYPVLGAILSGAVAGDHISPISSNTIMSTTSTEMVHVDHVQTQMTYAVPVIGICAFGFWMVAHILHMGVGTAVGLTVLAMSCLTVAIFSMLNGRGLDRPL